MQREARRLIDGRGERARLGYEARRAIDAAFAARGGLRGVPEGDAAIVGGADDGHAHCAGRISAWEGHGGNPTAQGQALLS